MELLDKGEHCACCGQIDFLPFSCAGCKQHFCLEHRTAKAHSCPEAGSGDQGEVIVCPLCARGVKLRPGEAPDAAFERCAVTWLVPHLCSPCALGALTTPVPPTP